VEVHSDVVDDLQRELHEIESNHAKSTFVLDTTATAAKQNIVERLKYLTRLAKYPKQKGNTVCTTGYGDNLITIILEYGGIDSWFFGWFERSAVELKAEIHYEHHVEEFSEKLVTCGENNAYLIADFLKSVVERAQELAQELDKKNPLYKTDPVDFETQLVLETADLLGDPTIAVLYTSLLEIDEYKEQCLESLVAKREEVKKRIAEINTRLDDVEAGIKEIDVGEEIRRYKVGLMASVEEMIEKKKQEIEKAAELEFSATRAAKKKENDKLKTELNTLEKKKGQISYHTKQLAHMLDRMFPNYDFGRNSKHDPEDVDAHLRSECAVKLGKLVQNHKDVTTRKIEDAFNLYKRARRSAGQKFNGNDLRQMVTDLYWATENLKWEDVMWVLKRTCKRYSPSVKLNEIRKAFESVINENHK
jgi:hypothetical protein